MNSLVFTASFWETDPLDRFIQLKFNYRGGLLYMMMTQTLTPNGSIMITNRQRMNNLGSCDFS